MSERLMVDAAIVFLIGAIVGVSELIARYKDNPGRAIRTPPALVYVAINGLASLFALTALVTFGWTADTSATPEAQRLVLILAAGFGAMALFRSSLFVVRVGSTDVGVGPVALLQILLAATDRGVDRKRASDRAEKVVQIMKDLEFAVAYNALPPFAIMLMQNLSAEDKIAMGNQVVGLAEPKGVPEQTKILNLGLMLMNYVGEEVLEDAVRGVRGERKPETSRLPGLPRRSRTGRDESRPHDTGDPAPTDSTRSGPGGVDERVRTGPTGTARGGPAERSTEAPVSSTTTQPNDPPAVSPEPATSTVAEPPPGTSAPGTPIPRADDGRAPTG
jgi:hypothetical protein